MKTKLLFISLIFFTSVSWADYDASRPIYNAQTNLSPYEIPQSTLKRKQHSPKNTKKIIVIADDPSFQSNAASNQAMNFLDIPYRWGGLNIQKGLDCSGFVYQSYKSTYGIELPRTSVEMAKQLPVVQSSLLRPGDLVFFNTRGHSFSHVGIYLGGKLFAHAPRTGKKTRIENIMDDYWFARFNGARRPLTHSFTTPSVSVKPPDFNGDLFDTSSFSQEPHFDPLPTLPSHGRKK